MKEYRFRPPRVIFGLAALAMSTLTIGALVELPARFESEGRSSSVMVAARPGLAQCVAAFPESRTRGTN
ncbi:MAG: hypothetical protein ABI569_03545 [Casimicrobiaceae bacterium]